MGGAEVGGYSETEVGLRDRDGEGSSFGAITAVEETVVAGETAGVTRVMVSVAGLEDDSAGVAGVHCTACMACSWCRMSVSWCLTRCCIW